MNHAQVSKCANGLAHVLWMGGSPCSGKSSIAEMLAKKHGLRVYKCDDAFWEHAKRVDPVVHPTFHRLTHMTWDEIWMRSVAVQIADEFACYREQFAMILDDLLGLPRSMPVIAEGAALLPDLVSGLLPDRSQAVWVIPTESFQREHYTPEKRPFIDDILAHCQNPTQAFANWMDRDGGFAKRVAERARALDLKVLAVDGKRTIEQNAEIVAQYLGLE
jgi:2-phosphoglycerate kinase